MHHKKYFGLLGMTVASVLCAQSAFAAITWDFRNKFATEPHTLPVADTTNTHNVTAQAWSIVAAVSPAAGVKLDFDAAIFTDQGTIGFGVCNPKEQPSCSSGSNKAHAVDNSGSLDFVIFDFGPGQEWQVTSATAGWAHEHDDHKKPEADLYYWDMNDGYAGTDGLSGWDYVGQGKFKEGASRTIDFTTTNGVGSFTGNTGPITSRYWLLAANACEWDARSVEKCPNKKWDAFKLTELQGVAAPPDEDVPEPATALLLLAALPFIRRRGIANRKS